MVNIKATITIIENHIVFYTKLLVFVVTVYHLLQIEPVFKNKFPSFLAVKVLGFR